MKKENIFTKIVEKKSKCIFMKPISTSVFGNPLIEVNIINSVKNFAKDVKNKKFPSKKYSY